MSLPIRTRAVLGALTLATVIALPAAPAAAATVATSSIPVTFTVSNVDRSVFSCPTDGLSYTVSGHLVGPTSQLKKARPSVGATLYLHGLNFGEFFWDFDAPGYDYALTQARAGQISVTVDRIGYGASGKPAGNLVCVGSQADIAHQMIGDLRTGNYRVGSGTAPTFGKIALAGHSYGGQIAELEAYSFHDVNAVAVISYTDQGTTAFATKSSDYTAAVCAAGGVAGMPGYAPYGNPADAKPGFFHDVSTAIFNQAKPKLSVNPCGDMIPFATASAVNAALVGTIKVPVLVVSGAVDKLFPPTAAERQVLLYTGSPEVTLHTLDDTAHAVALEKTRKTFALVMRNWLNGTSVR